MKIHARWLSFAVVLLGVGPAFSAVAERAEITSRGDEYLSGVTSLPRGLDTQVHQILTLVADETKDGSHVDLDQLERTLDVKLDALGKAAEHYSIYRRMPVPGAEPTAADFSDVKAMMESPDTPYKDKFLISMTLDFVRQKLAPVLAKNPELKMRLDGGMRAFVHSFVPDETFADFERTREAALLSFARSHDSASEQGVLAQALERVSAPPEARLAKMQLETEGEPIAALAASHPDAADELARVYRTLGDKYVLPTHFLWLDRPFVDDVEAPPAGRNTVVIFGPGFESRTTVRAHGPVMVWNAVVHDVISDDLFIGIGSRGKVTGDLQVKKVVTDADFDMEKAKINGHLARRPVDEDFIREKIAAVKAGAKK